MNQLRSLVPAAVAVVTLFAYDRSAGSDPVKSEPVSSAEEERLKKRIESLEQRLAVLEGATSANKRVAGQIPFGSLVGNLKADRSARYLRLNIVVVTDEKNDQVVSSQLALQKAALSTWLHGYIADQSVDALSGTRNVERVRAEIAAEFDRRLSPAKQAGMVKEVLFTDFIVQ